MLNEFEKIQKILDFKSVIERPITLMEFIFQLRNDYYSLTQAEKDLIYLFAFNLYKEIRFKSHLDILNYLTKLQEEDKILFDYTFPLFVGYNLISKFQSYKKLPLKLLDKLVNFGTENNLFEIEQQKKLLEKLPGIIENFNTDYFFNYLFKNHLDKTFYTYELVDKSFKIEFFKLSYPNTDTVDYLNILCKEVIQEFVIKNNICYYFSPKIKDELFFEVHYNSGNENIDIKWLDIKEELEDYFNLVYKQLLDFKKNLEEKLDSYFTVEELEIIKKLDI